MVASTVPLSSFTFAGSFMPSKTLPNEKLEECRDLYLQGKKEYQKNNYVDSVRLYLKAVYLQEMLLGKYHQDTIKTYWRLGRAAVMAQQDQQAVEAYFRAARFAETTFDEKVVQSLIHDVDAVWAMQVSAEDEETRSPSTTTSGVKSPRDSLEKLLALEKAADIACKKESYKEALDSYQQAVDLLTAVAGSDSACVADLRVKQSTCHLKLNHVSEAARSLGTAHECYMRRLGENHPATLGAAASLRTLQQKFFKNKGDGSKKGMWWTASLSSLGSNNSGRQDTAPSPTSSP
ncbi:MAG: hypothetical protein SGILL_002049 [Bacillariaceae sp.]